MYLLLSLARDKFHKKYKVRLPSLSVDRRKRIGTLTLRGWHVRRLCLVAFWPVNDKVYFVKKSNLCSLGNMPIIIQIYLEVNPVCSTVIPRPSELIQFAWPSGYLPWRHNGLDSITNHQPHDCLLNRFFRRRWKKSSEFRFTGLCVVNSRGPVNSPHKWPITRKMFPYDDVILYYQNPSSNHKYHPSRSESNFASQERYVRLSVLP